MKEIIGRNRIYVPRGREEDNVSFKTWVINLFEDERGETSIKPLIAFFGSLFLCGSMLASSFYPGFVPADFLVDAVMIITSIGMGADSVDKFSSKNGGHRRDRNNNDYSDGYFEEGRGTNSKESAKESATDNKIGSSSNELL